MKPPKAVSAYMAAIGAEGGKKGGTAKGKRKARSPEHYRKMAEARKKKRARSNQGAKQS
jgi:hypothetical protein